MFRDDEDGCVGAVAADPGFSGKAFRRFEADIDVGGLGADSTSAGSSIGCRIQPELTGPSNDFESEAWPPLLDSPLWSHDKVRRRGALYSPPDTSVSDDKNE